jgi:cobalt/nickel transport system permease protein
VAGITIPAIYFPEIIISKIESSLQSLGYMDLLSYQDTALHKIDPRAKFITSLFFILTVISFGKYEISMLMPFVFYPVFLLTAGNIPAGYILKKILYVSPFAFMIGVFNPFFDQNVILHLGNTGISGGWISFISIMLRFALTVSTALALIACTGFNNICFALNRLGAPKIFAVQLLFLYRYIFVLAEEAARMVRARNLRSFNGKGKGIKTYGPLLGNLLLRTINRAERIHLAMICRGFDGNIRIMNKYKFGLKELFFVSGWISLFLILRFINISQLAGILVTGLFI